jgi:general secretion pathway protein J
MRTSHTPSRLAGFTLIELLVAISVMAMLALMSWQGIDGMLRAQDQTRQRSNDVQVVQTALAQWGADLDAVLSITNTTPLDWDGQVLRITRRSNTNPDLGPQVVAWTRRSGVDTAGGGQWVRWQSPLLRSRAEWNQAWQQAAQWARTPGDAERRREVVLMPLESWQIFYHRGGAWSNALSSSGNAPTAPGLTAPPPTLPDGIRLQLTLPAGQALSGNIVRDWVSPTLTPNPS